MKYFGYGSQIFLFVAEQMTVKHTSEAVPFEVVDGADVVVLAGLGLAHGTCARAFTGLRTVLSHKLLLQLRDGGREI